VGRCWGRRVCSFAGHPRWTVSVAWKEGVGGWNHVADIDADEATIASGEAGSRDGEVDVDVQQGRDELRGAEENSNEKHGATASGTAKGRTFARLLAPLLPGLRGRWLASMLAEQLTGLGEVVRFHPVGEEAIVPNIAIVLLGDVLDQTINEEEDREFLECRLPLVVVVLVLKRDVLAIVRPDSVFADHRALRITATVADRRFGFRQGATNQDMPLHPANEPQEGTELNPATPVPAEASLDQSPFTVGFIEGSDDTELPFRGQLGPRNERILWGMNEPGPVFAEAPTGDDDVEVDIPFQIASEGVNDDDDPGEISLGSGHRLHSFAASTAQGARPPQGQRKDGVGGGPADRIEEDNPVVLDRKTDLPRQRCRDMAIRDIQQVREKLFTPEIGSHLAAGRTKGRLATVGNDPLDIARGTVVDMQPKTWRPTGQHPAHMVALGFPNGTLLPCEIPSPVVLVAQDGSNGDVASDFLHGIDCPCPGESPEGKCDGLGGGLTGLRPGTA